MLTCIECNNRIEDKDKLTYILPDLSDPPGATLKYMHYPECSTKYFNRRTEAHIIRGEN